MSLQKIPLHTWQSHSTRRTSPVLCNYHKSSKKKESAVSRRFNHNAKKLGSLLALLLTRMPLFPQVCLSTYRCVGAVLFSAPECVSLVCHEAQALLLRLVSKLTNTPSETLKSAQCYLKRGIQRQNCGMKELLRSMSAWNSKHKPWSSQIFGPTRSVCVIFNSISHRSGTCWRLLCETELIYPTELKMKAEAI